MFQRHYQDLEMGLSDINSCSSCYITQFTTTMHKLCMRVEGNATQTHAVI